MKPEEVRMIPEAQQIARIERNEALGTGGKWWRMLLAGLGLAVMLAGGCASAVGTSGGGPSAERSTGQGVTGTPTFLINGETLVGAQPREVFEEAIEKAAREAEHG